MRIILAAALLALGGCSGAQVASFSAETIARGVVGKIDNDGGLFGVNTSTVISTPEQQAQKARDALIPKQNKEGTTIINAGGAQAGGYGYPQQQQYGGGFGGGQGYGYEPPPWGYGRGW